jgi:hypothetical protein
MTTQTPVRQTAPQAPLDADLARARQLAHWLDAKFSFLGFRFGLEGVAGFVPVVGDAAATAAGLYPIYLAQRHKLGSAVQAHMAINLGLGWALGFVPVLGGLADVWFKPNMRNLRLLEQAAGHAG